MARRRSPKGSIHTWRFFRAGGFDQVRLDSGADIAHLDELDQKLWVALACPTRGLELDARTLDLIDTDQDGRIRAPEIMAASKWACALLRNPDDLLKSSASLPLDTIHDATPEGKQLLASAKQILADLGKPDAAEITLDDTADTAKIFSQTNFNGDGVVPVDAADDESVKGVMADIIACLGAEADRSGKPGVTRANVDQFFDDARAFADWWQKAEGDAAILPLGEATSAAAATLDGVKGKVDDYFARCRLGEFDARALSALNRQESEYLSVAAKDLSITGTEIAGFPLARIEAGKPLPLHEGVNPAWAEALSRLQAEVVKPLLGDKTQLSAGEWRGICEKLAPYEAWASSKAGGTVEKLGIARIGEILSGESREAILALIARDEALEPVFNSITAVDRLIRYHRDLYKLLTNFVSFRAFYSRREKAVFQAGTLYLDQRSCELCIRVEDMARHGTMAGLSRCYIAYCDCVRRSHGEKMSIAAAFTDGDSDNLIVGRNGVFYDRQGRDWDATITRIVDNPISIRQAFWSPYKKLIRLIEEQIAKRAAAMEAASDQRLASTAETVATADQSKPAPPRKIDIGTVAAIGVAVGGIAAAFGALLGAFFGLGVWMPVGLVGLVFLVSAPSMMIAWLKLRQRNLGPLLDANGWAVNARAKINLPFGRSLTGMAKLPPGAKRDLLDPYAESRRGRKSLVILILLLGMFAAMWYFGVIEKAVPNVFPKSGWLKRRELGQPPSGQTQPAAPQGQPQAD